MESNAIAPDIIKMAEEITLAELLELTQTTDASIRFICAIRKAIFQSSPDPSDRELLELEGLINRIYQMIGYDRRAAAFESGNLTFQRDALHHTESAISRPAPVLIAPPPAKLAERFLGPAAVKTVDKAIEKQLRLSSSFVFSEIKKHVEDIHTKDGDLQWDPVDLEAMASGTRRWESTLQTVLAKKRDEEELFLKTRTKEYLILSAIS